MSRITKPEEDAKAFIAPMIDEALLAAGVAEDMSPQIVAEITIIWLQVNE